MNLSALNKKVKKAFLSGQDYRSILIDNKGLFHPKFLGHINDLGVYLDIAEYFIKTRDRNILTFAKDNTERSFDLGRYHQYREYRALNLSDSFSDKFFQLKYGDDLWFEKKALKLKNKPNPYDINHYLSQGISHAEASQKIQELKVKTAPNLKRDIDRYGYEKGVEKFNRTVRRHKNYLDWWVKKCGGNLDEAQAKLKEYRRQNNSSCIEYYTSRGFSEAEAIEFVSLRQRESAGVHPEYWKKRGLSEAEISEIMDDINGKKDSSSFGYFQKKYPNVSNKELHEIYSTYNMSKSSVYREHGYLLKDSPNLERMVKYYASVDYYTKRSIPFMPDCQGQRGKLSHEYHVDHKFSKKMGYLNNIPPEVIGHYSNLEWLRSQINCSKRADCSVTIEELYERYENENKINC